MVLTPEEKKGAKILAVAFVLIFFVMVPGCVYLGYKVWRLQHPDAPTWTFFVNP